MLGTWLGIIVAACAVVAAWVGVAKLRDDRRREREVREEREAAQRAAQARAAKRRLEVVDRLPEGFSAHLPEAGQPVDPNTYHEEYEKELKAGEPFLGPAMMKDAFFSALVVVTVIVPEVALAETVVPVGESV
jgi:hypothetical protein